MEELSMVFEDRLIESTYVNGLIADYDGQGRAHRRRENMITEDHIKGSRRGHENLSQDRLDRRLAGIKVQLELMEGLLQKNGEDQRYGWILPKKVTWYMLQKKLRQRINVQWKRGKLIRDELQQERDAEDINICEPEQGPILGEDSNDEKDRFK